MKSCDSKIDKHFLVWSCFLLPFLPSTSAKYEAMEGLLLDQISRANQPSWTKMSANEQDKTRKDLKQHIEAARGDIDGVATLRLGLVCGDEWFAVLGSGQEALLQLYQSVFTQPEIFNQLFGDNAFDFSQKILQFSTRKLDRGELLCCTRWHVISGLTVDLLFFRGPVFYSRGDGQG